MSIFREYNIEVVYRSGPRNANTDYLFWHVARDDLDLAMDLEPDLKSVVEYLSRRTIDRASWSVVRAVKTRAKNHHMHEGDIYWRTAKVFRLVPEEKARIPVMKGLDDEIGHSSFAKAYEIILDRFWWPRIRIDVAHSVRSCDSCQKANP